MKKNLAFTLSILLIFGNEFAYCLTSEEVVQKEKINEWIQQFVTAMNTRDKTKISNFMTYYVDNEGKFRKKVMVMDKTNQVVNEQLDYEFNKNEYIECLINSISKPIKYAFNVEIQEIDFKSVKYFGIAKLLVKEKAIGRTTGRNKIQFTTTISTSCNLLFDLQKSSISLAGNNCIEKIVIE